MCIYFINDPVSILSYTLWGCETLAANMADIALISYFRKNCPSSIKGLLFACIGLASLTGKTVAIEVGSVLYKKYGRNAPFMFIGACDLGLALTLFTLVVLGKFGYYIAKV